MTENAPKTPQPAPPLTWKDRARAALPMLAFAGGFLWDSITLKRVDRLVDNFTLLTYLILLGGLIALSARLATEPDRWPRLAPRKAWVDWGVQFFFGGLYSAYVIFYFKSATWGPTLLFLLILAGLLVANEFLDHHLRADGLRVALYALCAFSFLLFFVPVVTGYAGIGVFTLAAIGAAAAAAAVAWLAWVTPDNPAAKALPRPMAGVAAMLGLLFVLDLAGLIPPVPLALMGGGIFRGAARTPDGYEVTYEAPPWWAPFRQDDRWFRYRKGDRVVCFSAIFAPTDMALSIAHVWERWDEEEGWVEMSRIPFSVTGGRDGGYRGWTVKKNVPPGQWRVRVVTEADRELGRYALTVDEGPWEAPPDIRSRLFR